MNGIDDATSELERATLAGTELASSPASVDEPAVDLVFGHTLCEHLGVTTGVEDDEGCTVASGEGRDGFENTVLGSRSFPVGEMISYFMIGWIE